jgi:GT2 family glycosyltransferase
MQVDVSIVVVSYNGRALLQKCLETVEKMTHSLSFEVIVVDNASTDGTLEMLAVSFPSVSVVRNAENRGFAAANNQGIALAKGTSILLLNPDIELQEDAIGGVYAFMRDRADVGIAACRLVYADGTPQKSVGVFPNIAESLLDALFLSNIVGKGALFRRQGMTRLDDRQPMPVEWSSGAFLLIKRAVIEQIGVLDEQFFVYTEETDFCYRAAQAGFGVWHVPQFCAIHHWAGMSAVTRRGLLWLVASQILFLKKHYPWLRRSCLLFLKYFGLLVRVPVHGLLGIITGNRERIQKAWYMLYVPCRLLTMRWRYDRSREKPVRPWTEVFSL